VIAVVGATGFVGRHVVARLVASKTPIRAVSRTLGPPNAAVSAAAADLLHPPSLAVALTGVETIVHCAAITADKKEAYRGQYHDVNATGTRNLVDLLAMPV